MKRLSKYIAAFVMALMLTGIFGNVTVAQAATLDEVKEYENWETYVSSYFGDIGVPAGLTDLDGDGAINAVDFKLAINNNDAAYSGIRDLFIDYLKNTKHLTPKSKSDQVADKIGEINDKVNIKADLEGGSAWLSEETIALISQIIGFLTVIVLMAVGLFTAVDIMFLTIPPLHAALEEKAAAKGTTDKNGNAKPRIVSTDASLAWQEAAETGKNVLIIYLKKRLIAYIAIAIVVYMLLSGNLTAIITLVLKLISGALDSVEQLA